MTQNNHKAIIKIEADNKDMLRVNYGRRMYAIIRRYTPEVIESNKNECLADLTGLRTFFKMSYEEITKSILKELTKEIKISFVIKVITIDNKKKKKNNNKKSRTISTYKEMNKIFAGSSFIPEEKRNKIIIKRKIKLTVPFLGKVD